MNKKPLVGVGILMVIVVLAVIFLIYKPSVTEYSVNQQFSEFKTQYQEKKADGYDVIEAEELAKKSKQAYDIKDYEKAKELLDMAFEALVNANIPTTTFVLPAPTPHEKLEEVLVISGIPFLRGPSKGVSKPSWKEIEEALPSLNQTGVNTIFIWAPHEHRFPETREYTEVYTANGPIELNLEYFVHIKDYLQPDPDRGYEEEFLHMVETAHSLGIKVIAQLQVTASTQGDFIYDEHPEWMLKSIYGAPVVVWPFKPFSFAFVVNKAHPDLINYVTEIIIPHWVKNWNVDGVYLDSPAMAYSDLYIRDLCQNVESAKGYESLTPVDGYYSPEPLVEAIEKKMEDLEKEVGRNLIFSAEDSRKTWRDAPDDLIIKACEGEASAHMLDSRVDRSMGTHFVWVMNYNFRGLLKNVYDGGEYSYSKNYVKFLNEYEFDREYTETARFVNIWVGKTESYVDLLKPENAGNYITLDVTAPGKVVFIGVYQLPPQTEVLERLFGYDSDVLKEWYTETIKIKKEYRALQTDNIEDALISPKMERLISYNRWHGNESVSVIVNANNKEVNSTIQTRFEGDDVIVYDLLSGESFSGNPKRLKIYMPIYSSRILVLDKKEMIKI